MIRMIQMMLTILIPKCHTTITTRGSIMLGGRSSMMGGRSSMMGGRNSMMGGGRQSMLKSRGRRSTAKITLPGPSSTTASSVRESSFVVIHVWWTLLLQCTDQEKTGVWITFGNRSNIFLFHPCNDQCDLNLDCRQVEWEMVADHRPFTRAEGKAVNV